MNKLALIILTFPFLCFGQDSIIKKKSSSELENSEDYVVPKEELKKIEKKIEIEYNKRGKRKIKPVYSIGVGYTLTPFTWTDIHGNTDTVRLEPSVGPMINIDFYFQTPKIKHIIALSHNLQRSKYPTGSSSQSSNYNTFQASLSLGYKCLFKKFYIGQTSGVRIIRHPTSGEYEYWTEAPFSLGIIIKSKIDLMLYGAFFTGFGGGLSYIFNQK